MLHYVYYICIYYIGNVSSSISTLLMIKAKKHQCDNCNRFFCDNCGYTVSNTHRYIYNYVYIMYALVCIYLIMICFILIYRNVLTGGNCTKCRCCLCRAGLGSDDLKCVVIPRNNSYTSVYDNITSSTSTMSDNDITENMNIDNSINTNSNYNTNNTNRSNSNKENKNMIPKYPTTNTNNTNSNLINTNGVRRPSPTVINLHTNTSNNTSNSNSGSGKVTSNISNKGIRRHSPTIVNTNNMNHSDETGTNNNTKTTSNNSEKRHSLVINSDITSNNTTTTTTTTSNIMSNNIESPLNYSNKFKFFIQTINMFHNILDMGSAGCIHWMGFAGNDDLQWANVTGNIQNFLNMLKQ